MDDREMIRRWVDAWKAAGPVLDAVRREDIENAGTAESLSVLEGAFNHAVRDQPPRPSSGLVEMQALLAKLPR